MFNRDSMIASDLHSITPMNSWLRMGLKSTQIQVK